MKGRLPRSYLFVPADRPDRIGKAIASGADAVVVDLEDAVAPSAKAAARAALAAWLGAHAPTGFGVVVRINGADHAAFPADLALCTSPAVAAVMLPKAGQDGDLDAVRSALPGKPIVALVETAEGFDRLREIARAPAVVRLAFGTIDFQLDLGISGDGEALLAFRSRFVLESRLAQLPAPVDGITTVVDDADQVFCNALAARRLGFGAKLCIHPRQVEPVNRGFAPGEAELEWARRVVDAAARAGGAAVAVDGKMVDRPVLLRAQTLLRQRRD
jgi:citrate lyase subunit beta/citryl-CoA lyase